MSIENLKEFGKIIAEDDQVRNRVKEIGLNWEGIAAYGKELGLEFNEEDFKALADEAGVIEDELTEEQLETIAGVVVNATLVAAGVAAIVTALAGPDPKPKVKPDVLHLIPSNVLNEGGGPHKLENVLNSRSGPST